MKNRRLWLSLLCVCLICMILISCTNQQPVETVPYPMDPIYYLDIKGNSNQLSEKEWSTMQAWRKQIVKFAKQHPKEMFINGPDQPMVALTFDDGPDAKVTPAIVDILKKYEVPASFFFLGSNVKQYPKVVKKTYDNGNLVLSHSYRHADLTKLKPEEVKNDLQQTEAAIEAVIGQKPAMLRTPFGETNASVVDTASKLGYSIVLWSIDTLDWSQKEKENISKNVLDNVRNGDIILMHSGKDNAITIDAVPTIIEELQRKGFKIVDLETLLKVKAYK